MKSAESNVPLKNREGRAGPATGTGVGLIVYLFCVAFAGMATVIGWWLGAQFADWWK